jgi:hypothetical protein
MPVFRPFAFAALSSCLLFTSACSATGGGGAGAGAAGAAGGGGAGGGSGGFPIGGGGGTGGLDDSCGKETIPTFREPGALLIVFDASYSMTEDEFGKEPGDIGYDASTSKWNITTNAVNGVLAGLPQDAQVGLLVFPNSTNQDKCDPLPEAQVEVGELAITGGVIEVYLNPNDEPSGSVTPLAQALQAGHEYLSTVPVSGPRAVLLVTDGAPSPLCGQSGDETAQVAGTWAGMGQLTFAVGLDGSSPNLMSKTASNGGTPKEAGCDPNCCASFGNCNPSSCCHYVAEGSSTQQDLTAALDTIAGSFLASCYFEVPKGADPSLFDPALVNVVVSVGGGPEQVVPQGDSGWEYVGTGTFDKLIIHDPLCAEILATPSEVNILLGCPTIVN